MPIGANGHAPVDGEMLMPNDDHSLAISRAGCVCVCVGSEESGSFVDD